MRRKCFCGRHTLNEETAFACVGEEVCCSNMCYSDAMLARQPPDFEPQGVSGALNGYNHAQGGWDVT